ncbi:MAG: hypothetical protein K0Q66_2303 [Chitinophagaceae bacterium]|jgi:hypothetical protein|nr:hypothetical protein [Chitinophagaceae bacterium]
MATIANVAPGRGQAALVLHKILLVTGILSALLYVFMNVITAVYYEGYDSASQTVSELSAIDAPTRPLWVALAFAYAILGMAFGSGVWMSGRDNKSLRAAGVLLVLNALIGFFWPPMHQREVLAAGGGTWTDTLHIWFTFAWIILVIATMRYAAAGLGKTFRVYTYLTLLALVVFGALTGFDAPAMQRNEPTPWMGVVERVNIGAYLAWVVVLAWMLLKGNKKPA